MLASLILDTFDSNRLGRRQNWNNRHVAPRPNKAKLVCSGGQFMIPAAQ